MKKGMGRLLATAVVLLMPAMASAATIAVSTFDTTAEGWEVGDLFSASGAVAPTHVASGGNPGGFIRTNDFFNWNAFQAPASFIGNQSAAYGGTLSFDTRLVESDVADSPQVVIGNGSLMLQFRSVPPTTDWTPRTVTLLASAGWQIATTSGTPGPAATEAQLQSVLSSLTFLNILADWRLGDDQVDLDNVRLCDAQGCGTTPVPEPSTMLLLGAGLAGLARRLRVGAR